MLHSTLSLGLDDSVTGAQVDFDPDAETLFAAMVPPPNQARKILINDLILRLKADGIWPLLDLLYVFAAHAVQPAVLNWKVPTTFTCNPTGGGAFTVDRGFTGNGTDGQLLTGWVPSVDSVQLQVNSAHCSAWSLTSVEPSVTQRLLGTTTAAGDRLLVFPRRLGDQYHIMVNDGSSSTTIANASSDGFFVANRSDANAREGYRNGVLLGSDAQPAVARSNAAITFLRDGANFATLEIACGSLGASLNASQVSDFYDGLLAYMTAVGAAP